MTEQQRVRIIEKAQKRGIKEAWRKSTKRIKKKRATFLNSSPQKSCGTTVWYLTEGGEWKYHFVSNRAKHFGVMHERAVKLSLL